MTNLITRILKGAKKGLFTPTLPDHIIVLNHNPLIRIFRVVGGISTVLILTPRLAYLVLLRKAREGLLYSSALALCTIFSSLLGLYLIYITYHRIRHMVNIMKNGELDIRNSP